MFKKVTQLFMYSIEMMHALHFFLFSRIPNINRLETDLVMRTFFEALCVILRSSSLSFTEPQRNSSVIEDRNDIKDEKIIKRGMNNHLQV